MIMIRTAMESDIPKVRQFVISVMKECNIYDPGYPDQDLTDLTKAFDLFLVAEGSGRIIATGGIHRIDEDFAFLRRFYVARDFRGQGLGRSILHKLIAFSKRQGFSAIITASEKVLVRAKKVYLDAGFQIFKAIERDNLFVKFLKESHDPDSLAQRKWRYDWKNGRWALYHGH